MNQPLRTSAVAALLCLGACGGQGDDALADNVSDAYEAKADLLEEAAENASIEPHEEVLEQKAEATREKGETVAEAIDEADMEVDRP